MRKAIIILMVVADAFLLASCSSIQYRKFDITQISLPSRLNEAFKNTTIEQIEWYLAASKDWEFTKIRENAMACKYIQEEIYESYVKITVFTQGFFDTGAKYEPSQTIDSTSETVDIDVYKRSRAEKGEMGSDRYFSSIIIKFSDAFFVRFDEYSYDTERSLTVDAVNDVFMLFGDELKQKDELRNDGSINIEHENLEIVRNRYGTYDISGFVHLSKKNSCRIKVVDAVTNEIYFDQLIDAKSEFYVGWSDVENERFSFNQRLTIKKKGNAPKNANVIIQLWVNDEDGSRCVLEKNTNIEFWVR